MRRHVARLPSRGEIGIHNRSWYEEVLIARVHDSVLARQRLPEEVVGPKIWDQRLEDMYAEGASPTTIAFITAVAAGAILAMLTDTMVPEAVERTHLYTGLVVAARVAYRLPGQRRSWERDDSSRAGAR